MREIGNAVQQQEALGHPTVLLVPDRLRWPLARLLRRGASVLRVLAHSEIPDARTIRYYISPTDHLIHRVMMTVKGGKPEQTMTSTTQLTNLQAFSSCLGSHVNPGRQMSP